LIQCGLARWAEWAEGKAQRFGRTQQAATECAAGKELSGDMEMKLRLTIAPPCCSRLHVISGLRPDRPRCDEAERRQHREIATEAFAADRVGLSSGSNRF
jgi:hypothetical protein